MQTFEDITAARNAIMDFPIASLPADMRDRFRELRGSPSPVDQIVRLGEFLYARCPDISDDAKSLLGGLISFATINAWHGLTTDARGDKIVQAIRRDLGDTPPSGSAWPAEADDPAPRPEYAKQDETPAPAAA